MSMIALMHTNTPQNTHSNIILQTWVQTAGSNIQIYIFGMFIKCPLKLGLPCHMKTRTLVRYDGCGFKNCTYVQDTAV